MDQNEFDFDQSPSQAASSSPFAWLKKEKPGQQNLEFSGSEAGFDEWRDQNQKRLHDFEQKHGIVLNSKVRAELRFMAKPVEGTLTLGKGGLPNLKIRSLDFTLDDIVSLVRL